MAYIEREKVCEICKNKGDDCGKEKCPVYKVPTLDVVQVVRCEDCKYCEHCYPVKAIGEEAEEGWYCKIRKRRMRHDDFCSYGERKEDE